MPARATVRARDGRLTATSIAADPSVPTVTTEGPEFDPRPLRELFPGFEPTPLRDPSPAPLRAGGFEMPLREPVPGLDPIPLRDPLPVPGPISFRPGAEVAPPPVTRRFERMISAYRSRSPAAFTPTAMASLRLFARSDACSARNAATAAGFVARFASTMASSSACWSSAAVAKRASTSAISVRLTIETIAGWVPGGSGTGGRPLVSTMSACTSFSPS